MNNKHTPGPWLWTDDGELISPNHEEPVVLMAELRLTQTGRVYAALQRHYHEMQALANDRLIAAAPDLLDALEECVLQIEYLHEKYAETGSGNSVLARVRAAVSKAKGA